MSSNILLTAAVFVGVGTFVEKRFLTEALPVLYTPSPVFPAVARAFGLTPFVLICFALWRLNFGSLVEKARKEYKEAAEDAGETDVERNSAPNVQGTSEHAIKFNQVQHAHEQVLECLASMYMASFVCAFIYPVTTFISTSLWVYGRIVWSNAYAERGHAGHPMSVWIWRGLVANYLMVLKVAFCLVFS